MYDAYKREYGSNVGGRICLSGSIDKDTIGQPCQLIIEDIPNWSFYKWGQDIVGPM